LSWAAEEEEVMSKEINCAEVFAGCTFHAQAGTEEELLEIVAEHAAKTHGMTEVTPEVLQTIRSTIRERPSST
jgi:predicted small metal-binding protein